MSQLKWLLEYHFLRGNVILCQKIIEDMLREDPNMQEYTNYIQVIATLLPFSAIIFDCRWQGKIHYAEGRQQQALELFQTSYKLNASNPENLQQIAKCLWVNTSTDQTAT